MISRDAMQRLRSSPYGSVLGTLDALFSPHPLAGGPTPQQAASRGLLGQMLAQQATTAVSGTQGGKGGGGSTLGQVTLGAATGAAAGAAQRAAAVPAAGSRTGAAAAAAAAGGAAAAAGGAPGRGGGGSAAASLLSMAAAATSAADAAKYAYAAQKAFTGSETDVGAAAKTAAADLSAMAAATTSAGDAGKYAYAAQVAQSLGAKAAAAATAQAGQASAGAAQKTGLLSDYISRGLPLYAAAAGRFGFLQSHVQLFGGALTQAGVPAILAAASGLHLVTEAVIETAGTLIPAAVAFTAFGVAAVPTVKDLYAQLHSVYTVNQAFGAQIQPLTGGFTKMAQAVQPKVYTLFGEALVIANKQTGTFTTLAQQGGKALDDLGARFTYAVTQGNGFSTFVKHAGADLAGWGNLIGNIGGIIGGLLKAVPGYAETILGVLNSVTHGIEVVVNSGLGQWLLSIGLAAHGAILYIGLLASGFSLLASRGLAAAAPLLLNAAVGLERLGPAGKAAAGGMLNLAAGAEKAATLPWGWISIAAAGLGFLVYQLVNAKDAAQNFNASMQQVIANANLGNLQATITSAITATNQKVAQSAMQVTQAQKAQLTVGTTAASRWVAYSSAVKNAVTTHDQYIAGARQLNQQNALVQSRIAALGKQYGGTANALALLNGAGITAAQITSTNAQTWAEAQIEISAYNKALNIGVTSNGQYAAALNAINFAAGDSKNALGQVASALQSVSQDQSSLLNTIIGGQTALDTFEQGIGTLAQNFQQVTGKGGSVSTTLANLKGQASLAGAALGGTSQASYALNQAFYAQVQSAQSLVGSLEQSAASAGILKTVVATTAGQMTGFAGTNLEARTVLVDFINNALGPGTVSLQTLNKWVSQNSTSLQGMNSLLAQAVINASQLAGTLQQNLNQMLAQAAANALGGQRALNTFAAAVLAGNTSAQQLASNGGQQVLRMFQQMYQGDVPKAKQAFTDWAENGLGLSKSAANSLWQQLVTLQRQIDSMHGKTIPVTVKISETGTGSFVVNGNVTPTLSGGQRLADVVTKAAGGLITGGSGPVADDVPLMASGGEYVVKASSVGLYGVPAMAAVNAGRAVIAFAGGGMVPSGGFAMGPGWGGGGWAGLLSGMLSGASGGSAAPAGSLGSLGTAYVGNYTGVVSPASGGFGITAQQLGLPPPAASSTSSSAAGTSTDTGTSTTGTTAASTSKAAAKKYPDIAQQVAISVLEHLIGGYIARNLIGVARQASTLLDGLGVRKYDSQLSQIENFDSLWLSYKKKGNTKAEAATEKILAAFGVHGDPVLTATGNAPKAAVIAKMKQLIANDISANGIAAARQANAILAGLGVTAYTSELGEIARLDSLLSKAEKAKNADEVQAVETLLRGYGVKHFAQGGTVWEPVIGFGQRSGGVYQFAEHGPETVTPGASGGGDMVSELRALRGQMDKLIQTTASVPHGVTSGIGSALGGAAQSASFARRYHGGG